MSRLRLPSPAHRAGYPLGGGWERGVLHRLQPLYPLSPRNASAPSLRHNLPFTHHNLAPADGHPRPPRDRPALVRREVAVGGEGRRLDRTLHLVVPENEIGIRPNRDCALARVETEQSRRVG